MAEMAEIVQVIVEPLELREQNAQRPGANGRLAAGRTLDCLTVSERVSDRSHP